MNNRAAHPIDDQVRVKILERLRAAEKEHNVKILHAIESGSRTWGFASPDSDYDVRLIYAHPSEWYLSFDVERRRDVIEYPITDEIDCGGWDIKKALYLFTRTNGALLEWLNSPIIYMQHGAFAEKLRALAPKRVNYIALCYHYSHMARGNAREYLFKDKARLKKYFYVLRPLLAIRYIEAAHLVPKSRSVQPLSLVSFAITGKHNITAGSIAARNFEARRRICQIASPTALLARKDLQHTIRQR